MSKCEFISKFRGAIDGQDFILTRIKNCIKFGRDKEIIDIIGQENNFGNIMTDPKNKFEELLGSISYNGIMESYYQWREECVKIYEIYAKDLETKKPKLNTLTPSDIDVLKSKLDNLENIHKTIVRHCDIAMTRLNALCEDRFK